MNTVLKIPGSGSCRLIAAFVFFTCSLSAIPAAGETFSYDAYAATLAHVDDQGLVKYCALKEDRGRLDVFVTSLATLEKAEYESWGSKQRIAFWINAYNGLTLKAIIDRYPIKPSKALSLIYPENSIRQIPGVWKKLTFDVMGEMITLDHIEHHILRKEFDEPRIHMALVCAALNCPNLRNEPFAGVRLDEQLDDQVRRFLAVPKNFRIDSDGATVHLSTIFKWFGGDFVETYWAVDRFADHGEKERAVLNFISRYLPETQRRDLESMVFTIKYLEYDWTLNEKTGC